MKTWISIFFGLSIVLHADHFATRAQDKDDASTAEINAAKLFDDGNYQEARDLSLQILDDSNAVPETQRDAIARVLDCLQQLNQIHEVDGFLARMADQFADDWHVLPEVAKSYLSVPHYGYQIAGEFRRGNHRGGGKVLNSADRDRASALQLYWKAYQKAMLELRVHSESPLATKLEVATLLDQLGQAVMHDRGYRNAWRLQSLTRLSELPDYSEGWHQEHGRPRGAPVSSIGKPVFYDLPDSWDEAASDGERWRWLLAEAVRWNPELEATLKLRRAEFLQSQFGVQTLVEFDRWFRNWQELDRADQPDSVLALRTLTEIETIARLATGIKRFEFPDNHNPIKLLQSVVESPAPHATGQRQQAIERLATLFENRRQYTRAADYWRQASEQQSNKQNAEERLQQIVGNWGRFEPVMSQPAGRGATVDFRFRNGKRVEFTARKIDVNTLLTDVKEYLNSNPDKLNWEQLQIENLGYRLITQGDQTYLGEEVARWSLDLEPRPQHFDRRITVTTPLQEAGAYLLTSKMIDGNTTNIVLWLNDTAMVKKPLGDSSLYYVADAVTGKPLPKCNVEFFGYWQKPLSQNQFQIVTQNQAELTDESGLVQLAADDANRRQQWLAIATTPDGRLAYLGFRGIWSGDYREQNYQQVKVFSITDRPVYRPKQRLRYKFWVRHANYDSTDESKYAAQSFQIEIRDPKNEKVFTSQLISDAYGGLAGEWEIPEGASLGQYRINVVNHGGGTFRVEEYKKPEFEVTVDAPTEPVELGESVTATISAKYYFGSPVTNGTVKYKVLRTAYDQPWYAPMPWDWLYGPGYGWFAEEYAWYPGWQRWGCRAPWPSWHWQAAAPPEVVAEREVALGPDGSIEIEIDTDIAKQLHPDQDHRYQIQAEVVDQSRRSVVGNGRVLVGREPFKVHLWLDRGYYRAGDTIAVGVATRTLDAQPVAGSGKLRLLKVQYEAAEPVETEVGTWELPTGEEGLAQLQIKASQPGQYRLSYEVTDQQGHTREGGQMLTVAGEGFDGSQFRFNDLELVPDRRDYQPGDKIALQINTNRVGAAVLLFVRPSNGIYQPPQLVQLDGKSTVVELDVDAADMPNFFVEGVTIHHGKTHRVAREIFVPPASRALHVEVAPSAEAYLPGQAANVLLKLTDDQGKPFVGSLAVAIYDKAVEYIAGGTNVANIKAFFWRWRRSHRPQGETNLRRLSSVLVARDRPSMQNLGAFGNRLDEDSEFAKNNSQRNLQSWSQLGKSRTAAPLAAATAMPEGAMDDRQPANQLVDEGTTTTIDDLVQPSVRENFADTALWAEAIETNSEGIAEVTLEMPENLTTWKVRVWGMGHGTRVGESDAEIVTRKNLIVRLQAPRFFVETDEVVLSANVHNYLDEAKQVRVQLALEGESLTTIEQLERTVEIEAGGERRVDWRVKAVREGTATIRMSALTDEESDSMQQTFSVNVHGMLKTESFTGVIKPDEQQGNVTFEVPSQRRAEQTRLELHYTPTLAGAMIEALPYLLEYPYGCTEQTLNRFLPAVITQQTLRKMEIDLAEISERISALEAPPHSASTPVFDDAELSQIVKAGVNRLTEMQLSDGGWGWFSGWGERSSPHTTAVVMRGLLIARENDVAIVPSVVERGIGWLIDYQAAQVRLLQNWDQRDDLDDTAPHKRFADNLDALVYMTLVDAGKNNTQMREYLYRDRTKLSVYSLATFGLALQKLSLRKSGDDEKLSMILRNLRQYVRQDDENQTAWLELPSSGWWHWYGSEYEAQAYYLKLLAASDPTDDLAPRLVKYLLNNRQHATYWNSTRDTALVVEAFADYLAASGEDEPDVTVELLLDGQPVKEVAVSRDNLFTFDSKLVIAGEALAAGRHTLEIRKRGDASIYFSGNLTNFTLEDDIRAAGLELKVERQFYKLLPADNTTEVAGGQGQIVNQQSERYPREPLVNFAEVTSGDLIEVELLVDSKNDYEYLLLEDMKAAGCEPVQVRSGYNGNEMNAYVEYRDDRVSLFVTQLARGQHSLTYRLRAETPGQFSALPTRISAMYAPQLKGNSNEAKLRIAD